MLAAHSRVKYWVLMLGLVFLAGLTQIASANSCDIEDVCEHVEAEKEKLMSSLESTSGEDRDAESSSTGSGDDDDIENAGSETDSFPKFPTRKALDNIENSCGIGEDVLDSKCPLELVVKYCWQKDKKFAVKNCKSNH